MEIPGFPPLPAFRYWVMLKNSASISALSIGGALLSLAAGFTDCSGPEVTTEMVEYAEGALTVSHGCRPARSRATSRSSAACT